TPDYVNPERPWPAIDRLRVATEARGFSLAPRMTIYPSYALAPERWLDEAMRFPVMDHSDAEGLAREPGERWYSGVEEEPPILVPGVARRSGAIGEVLDGVLAGQRPGVEEIVTLFSARGPEVRDV